MENKPIGRIVSFLVLGLVIFSVSAAFANAQDQGIWAGTSGGGCNNTDGGCTLCDALIVTQNIINFLVGVAIAVSVLMIVLGAIRMMTSGGSEKNVGEAKKIITSALIGLAIALCAFAAINTILVLVGLDENQSGITLSSWFNLQCAP